MPTDDPIETAPTTDLAIDLRDVRVPATLDDLAALRGGAAVDVVESRAITLETARLRGIRLSDPEDWVLFRNANGRITGYLSDAGASKIRDLMGIEVFDVEEPRRIGDGVSFMYIQCVSARSKLTGQVVEKIEGGRSSGEDFAKTDTGPALDLKVKKACRANAQGRAVRELLGLQNVAAESLERGWAGTPKRLEHCNKGRGFGSQDERYGAEREGTPDVPPPDCPHCKTPASLRQGRGGKGAFYGCRNWEKAGHPKWTLDLDKWLVQQKAAADEVAAQSRLDAEVAARDAAAKR